MSRTLGPPIQDLQQSFDEDKLNEPFYLKNQLPMFLAHSDAQKTNDNNLEEDIAKCKELIESLCNNQLRTKEGLEEISTLLKQENDLSKSMGYFSAKNLVFLEYLILIKLYELFRINGKSLTTGNGLELYQRLAYLKTLLLKLSPIEKKLEYQKNKILKHSERAVVTKQKWKEESDQQEEDQEEESKKIKDKQQEDVEDENKEEDEMAFKPRPSALLKIKQQKDVKLAKNGKYEAPKVSSNLSKQDKVRQRMQRQKQIRKVGLIRRLQSDLIDDDRAEERYLGDEINERFKRRFQEKINYEEDAFTRLPDSKKDKFYMKQMVRNSTRKNQLEEDLREVQMVRQLFDNEEKRENKLMGERRSKKEGQMKRQKGDKTGGERKEQKTKHIQKGGRK